MFVGYVQVHRHVIFYCDPIFTSYSTEHSIYAVPPEDDHVGRKLFPEKMRLDVYDVYKIAHDVLNSNIPSLINK